MPLPIRAQNFKHSSLLSIYIASLDTKMPTVNGSFIRLADYKIKLQFRIGDINYIFTADVDSKLPQFSSQSAILEYDDERQLTSTREIVAQLNDGEFDVAFTNGVKAAGTLTHPVTTLTFAGEGNWNVD